MSEIYVANILFGSVVFTLGIAFLVYAFLWERRTGADSERRGLKPQPISLKSVKRMAVFYLFGTALVSLTACHEDVRVQPVQKEEFRIPECRAPLALDRSNRHCVNLQTDSENCGGLDRICVNSICVEGVCTFSCTSPHVICGSSCIDLMTDNGNCGGCGRMCRDDQVCSMGVCADRDEHRI